MRHQTKVTPLVGPTQEFDTRGGYLLTIFPLVFSSSYKNRFDPNLENKYSLIYPSSLSNAIFKIFRNFISVEEKKTHLTQRFLLRTDLFQILVRISARTHALHPGQSIKRRSEKKYISYNPVNPWKPCSVDTAKRSDKIEGTKPNHLFIFYLILRFYRFVSSLYNLYFIRRSNNI